MDSKKTSTFEKQIVSIQTGIKTIEVMNRLKGVASFNLINYYLEQDQMVIERSAQPLEPIEVIFTKLKYPKEIQHVFLQILRTVAYVHSNGIVLNCISPESIWMDPCYSVYFLDFSRSVLIDCEEIHNDGITHDYSLFTSPEVIFEPKRLNKWSDVYALGMTFKQLIHSKSIDTKLTFSNILTEMTALKPERRPSMDALHSRFFDAK